MAVGVDVDVGHGQQVLAGRADAQDGAVARARGHAPEQSAALLHVHAGEETGRTEGEVAAAQVEETGGGGAADNDQRVQVGEAQGQGAAAAGVALGVLVVVG